MSNLILITRPLEQAAILKEELLLFGCRAVVSPVLEVCLSSSFAADFSAALGRHTIQSLIITSRHAVTSVAGLADAKHIPVMTVGQETAEVLRSHGFSDVRCAGERVDALLEAIRTHVRPDAGSLCYVSGEHIKTDVLQALRPDGFDVVRLVAYEARAVRTLTDEAISSLRARRFTHAMFYSSRSAEIFIQLCRNAQIHDHTAEVTALAISVDVAHTLQALPWKSIRTASTPDSPGMLQLLEEK